MVLAQVAGEPGLALVRVRQPDLAEVGESSLLAGAEAHLRAERAAQGLYLSPTQAPRRQPTSC